MIAVLFIAFWGAFVIAIIAAALAVECSDPSQDPDRPTSSIWPALRDRMIAHVTRRPPDFVIGGAARPYLRRWYLLPRNCLFNVYLHQFLRSDDDRALHDHPWINASVLMVGRYTEHTVDADGHPCQRVLRAGDIHVRLSGRIAHRIELTDGPCWTLFLTGPCYRQWGFHCPQGWIHWKRFTSPHDQGEIGRGCDQ